MNSSSGTTAAPVAATPRPTQRTNSGSVSYSLLWRRPSTTTFSPLPTAADSTRLSSTRVVVQAAPSAAHSTTASQRSAYDTHGSHAHLPRSRVTAPS